MTPYYVVLGVAIANTLFYRVLHLQTFHYGNQKSSTEPLQMQVCLYATLSYVSSVEEDKTKVVLLVGSFISR